MNPLPTNPIQSSKPRIPSSPPFPPPIPNPINSIQCRKWATCQEALTPFPLHHHPPFPLSPHFHPPPPPPPPPPPSPHFHPPPSSPTPIFKPRSRTRYLASALCSKISGLYITGRVKARVRIFRRTVVGMVGGLPRSVLAVAVAVTVVVVLG